MRDLCRDRSVVSRCVRTRSPNHPANRRPPAVECLEDRVLMAATVYEAESAALAGATFAHSPGGFTGTGYADYRNGSGDSVEWTVDVADDGAYDLGVRFANGGSGDRPLQLSIDGAVAGDVLSFPSTGDWTRWETVTHTVTLSAGTHAVRLTAVGSSGANVDSLTVEPGAESTPPPPPPATQTLEAEDATFTGANASRAKSGFSGTGYIDFSNASGDYVEWSLDAAEGGTVDLQFRYANG